MWRRRSLVTLILFVLNISMVLAQAPCDEVPNPGDVDDPGYNPNGCPLDTWVYVLVGVAFIYAIYRLHQKQKSLSV